MTTVDETTLTNGRDATPGVYRDRAFWGMTATQFLGAFNDNLFKQLVLLICVDYVARRNLAEDPYQTTASLLFALPFVLLSGFAGFLSDRFSKRTIIVLAKVAEIFVMLAGMLVFLTGRMYSDGLLVGLFVVLGFMSIQSAFFGPSKYGILPELFHEHDLPRVNGMIQMTTFLAIIFGQAVCGPAKEHLEGGRLWMISAVCVGIAVVGTLTSLLIRRTGVAEPELTLSPTSFAVDKRTARMLRSDRKLLGVLLISSLFWFLGGVMPMAVNNFGKLQMGYGDSVTSYLLASIGVGTALGCVISGRLSQGDVRFGLVRAGGLGMVVMFCALTAVPLIGLSSGTVAWISGLLFLLLGTSAGMFAVPLQVFLQARPPKGQKGRMIGAMNLFNWIGILGSAALYQFCSQLFIQRSAAKGGDPQSMISWTFAVLAAILLPVVLFYRPEDEILD